MILYYKNDENEQDHLYLDFQQIHQRVNDLPVTSLYRLLRKNHCRSIRYQNRNLYPYKALLCIDQIADDIRFDDRI